MIFERRDLSRLSYDFISPFVLDLLENLASLISIGLDVSYFSVLSSYEIRHFLSEFVTYIVTATAMVM